MKLARIPCGAHGSVDCASLSQDGRLMAVSAAPSSRLRICDMQTRRWLSRWRSPRVQQVDRVTVAPYRDGNQVVFHRSRTNILERFAPGYGRLSSIAMPGTYDLTASALTTDGASIAVGDSYGNVSVFEINEQQPRQTYHNHFTDGGVYSLSWSADNRHLFIGNALGEIWWTELSSGENIALHQKRSQFVCYSISCHPENSKAVAIAGDGNRVWLLNLPFELPETESAGSGYPMAAWELDLPAVADRWALNNRIFTPRLPPEQVAWLDSEVGSSVHLLHLTQDWKLVVCGTSGMEIFDLPTMRMEHAEYWRESPSRRIFAVSSGKTGIVVAQES